MNTYTLIFHSSLSITKQTSALLTRNMDKVGCCICTWLREHMKIFTEENLKEKTRQFSAAEATISDHYLAFLNYEIHFKSPRYSYFQTSFLDFTNSSTIYVASINSSAYSYKVYLLTTIPFHRFFTQTYGNISFYFYFLLRLCRFSFCISP